MEIREWSRPQIRDHFDRCYTVADVVAEIERQFWTKGFVICDINVNGMVLSEDDELAWGKKTKDDIQNLKVRLYRVGELLRDTRKSIRDWINKALPALDLLAEDFRGGRHAQALNRFVEVIDGCHWLSQNVTLLRGLVDLEAQPKYEREWLTCEKKFIATVREISQANENKNYSTMADILEYELTTSLSDWSALLGELPSLSDC